MALLNRVVFNRTGFALGRVLALAAGLLVAADRSGAGTLDLATATIPELQAAYDGGLTAEQVVRVYLQRIEAYEQAGPALHAILSLNPAVLAQARALDAERRERGPRSLLHGVPLLIKDNLDTADLPTSGGARALAGSRALRDAFVVGRLRAAGALVMGKANLDEFARGATGTSSLAQTLNPYNLEKIAGGSSSGSAVGVAALFAWASVGTETGSSLRNPATKNHLVAFCPSEGLVSRGGVIPSSLIFDRVGPIARSAVDASILLAGMAGWDPRDLSTTPGLGHAFTAEQVLQWRREGLRGLRIGVLRQLFGREEEDRTATARVEAALAILRDGGAEVVDPVMAEVDLWLAVRRVSGGDGDDSRAALDQYFATRGGGGPIHSVEDLVASRGILGRVRSRLERDLAKPAPVDNPDFTRNYEDRLALRHLVTALMVEHDLDLLVYPHETKIARPLAFEVPDGGESSGPPDHRGRGKGNTLSSATGLPTLVTPIGANVDGVGVGLEFLGRQFDEATVARAAMAFETLAPPREMPSATPRLGSEHLTY